MVCIETFHDFENDIPCCFWVILKFFSLASFGEVTLPFPFSCSFDSLQVCMQSFMFPVVSFGAQDNVLLVGMVAKLDVKQEDFFILGEPVRVGFYFFLSYFIPRSSNDKIFKF